MGIEIKTNRILAVTDNIFFPHDFSTTFS